MLKKIRKTRKYLSYYLAFSKSKIILSAGMPRSGSTWLYNAARLIMLHSKLTSNTFSCGWIRDLDFPPQVDIMLIKVHNLPQFVAKKADLILYSYRDIRDALASSKRKSGKEPSMDRARYLIELDTKWRKLSDFTMRYETMIKNPNDIIERLASILEVKDIDSEYIVNEINKLSYDSPGQKKNEYNMVNLLHQKHITDGRHKSWNSDVDASLVKEIEKEYHYWFEKYNYL